MSNGAANLEPTNFVSKESREAWIDRYVSGTYNSSWDQNRTAKTILAQIHEMCKMLSTKAQGRWHGMIYDR